MVVQYGNSPRLPGSKLIGIPALEAEFAGGSGNRRHDDIEAMMPIEIFSLDGFEVDPETKRVLSVALEMTRVALGLIDDHANGIITMRIIELAKTGERNPDRLCEGALEKLRGHLYGD